MADATRIRIERVLVANRGEIARRVMRTCRDLGIETVAVYSDADRDAPYVREATHAVHLPGTAPTDTYLRVDLLIAAARRTGADAVHPGYGFLSENAGFAAAVADAGLTWIGPPAAAIEAMGSKIGAKAMMRAAGVPVLPDNTVESLADVGVPALVKASAGGGGRGMRIVQSPAELEDAIASAEREAKSAFGDGTVFVERYVEGGRHVEIQVFADAHDNVVALFERDCSLQRRHQKILEESPSPVVDDALRSRMSDAAVAAARAVGYRGAGTVEFLVDRGGGFYFLEMNTRLQVEHPVTEAITGLDLVELQLLVAAGEALPAAALHPTASGHAIEVRLCAEDPFNGYLPSSGTFHRVEFPSVAGVRIDTGVESGSVVSPYYDSMIAKVIAHAPTRELAARRIVAALSGAVLDGPTTNREQLIRLAASLTSLDDEIDTGYLNRTPMAAPPEPSAIEIAAAAMAVVRERTAARETLPWAPPGWHNNPGPISSQRVGKHTVQYRFDRRGVLGELTVDGEALEAADGAERLRHVRAEVIHDRGANTVYVAGGRFSFDVPPRYAPPEDAGGAGSLVAPMPGTVLRVLVGVGDAVAAGQPLVALEAMKMEHQVVAPTDGTVAEVFVTVGQQLDSGQALVRVVAAESP